MTPQLAALKAATEDPEERIKYVLKRVRGELLIALGEVSGALHMAELGVPESSEQNAVTAWAASLRAADLLRLIKAEPPFIDSVRSELERRMTSQDYIAFKLRGPASAPVKEPTE